MRYNQNVYPTKEIISRAVQIDYYPTKHSSNHTLLLVGGDGDTKEGFKPFSSVLQRHLHSHNISAFSYAPQKDVKSLNPTITDLKDACRVLIDNHKTKTITLFATSMGAYCASHVVVDDEYSQYIDQIILFDPADYHLETKKVSQSRTWQGFETYSPKHPTNSDLLQNIKAKTIIHVIHLTLKNHGPNGYVFKDYSQGGTDHPDMYPRLNTQMVKSFYEKIPQKNRGKYLENHLIPHAFMRDGDVKANMNSTTKIIQDCLF